jgi:hypothetical protein
VALTVQTERTVAVTWNVVVAVAAIQTAGVASKIAAQAAPRSLDLCDVNPRMNPSSVDQ